MEEVTADRSSTVDASPDDETCQERRELSNKGVKICEIINELTEFINEKVNSTQEADSSDPYTFYLSPVSADSYNSIDYHNHGCLPKNGWFALKGNIDIFHKFEISSQLHCVPNSATLYICSDDNRMRIPIKTVKIDWSLSFSFFNCPFPVSCFPRENFVVGFSYEPSRYPVDFLVLRLKDPLGIQYKIWDKMEEKGMYKR